jgi:uncharacterized protein YktA (UPF0223 family)
MDKLKGNKGEWSELYVLASLLAEGKLYQSDFELNKDFNNVYEVVKAYKEEKNHTLEFERNSSISLYKIENGNRDLIKTYSVSDIKKISQDLFEGINNGEGKSFTITKVEKLLEEMKIQKLKANSSVKSDLKLKIYDHRLAKETDLGFSIKSLLGGNSTLFNTTSGNNFIFNIQNFINESLDVFNARTYKPNDKSSKITFRLKELLRTGSDIKFNSIQSIQLWKNLKMIDGDLPEILGWALYYRYFFSISDIKSVCDLLEEKDPMNFYHGEKSLQRLYEYKIKKFLAEAAMGMTSEKPWFGEYDSFGGVIIAKEDGDIVCFHIYDFNLFRKYLLNNTVFEQASTGEDPNFPGRKRSSGKKYYYGWIDEKDGEKLIKLNLQIRFK